MIKFPQKGTPIMQAPRGNVRGNLWSTFNIDLQSNPGRIRLGDKLAQIYSSADDADLGVASAFECYNGNWYAICGTRVFVQSASAPFGSAWVEDTSSGAQTDYDFDFSDLAVFDGRLWSTTSDGLYSYNGTTWTLQDDLTLAECHKLAYLKNTNRLYYVSSDQAIKSIDADDVETDGTNEQYALALDSASSGFEITTMVATDKEIYISTVAAAQNTSGSYENVGYLFVWDGINTQPTSRIKIDDSAGLIAMKIHGGVLYAVDSRGRILRFNGYGFDEVSRLPEDTRVYSINASESSNTSGRGAFVHRNGVDFSSHNTMLIAVNGTRNSNYTPRLAENIPSGVWECDLATGSMVHKHSFTYKAYASSTVTDYGQYRVHTVGALTLQRMGRPEFVNFYGRADLITSASFYNDSGVSTADKTALFLTSGKGGTTDYEGEKRGYLVTTWVDSENMQDVWQKIGIKHREYLNANDKIVAKYRTREYDPVYADITWTSTTTFTTTTNISAYWTSGTGGEVEVTQGPGGGTVAHITSIVNNAGTYTVTIDEIATGVSNGNTAVARFQFWTKIAAVTLQSLESEIHAIGANSERIQIKVVMHFTGDGEFHEMQLVNKPHIQLE